MDNAGEDMSGWLFVLNGVVEWLLVSEQSGVVALLDNLAMNFMPLSVLDSSLTCFSLFCCDMMSNSLISPADQFQNVNKGFEYFFPQFFSLCEKCCELYTFTV